MCVRVFTRMTVHMHLCAHLGSSFRQSTTGLLDNDESVKPRHNLHHSRSLVSPLACQKGQAHSSLKGAPFVKDHPRKMYQDGN